MFDYIDGENIFNAALGAAGGAAVIALVVFLVMAMFADHGVRRYYVGQAGNWAVCAYADNPWSSDDTAYCSDDPSKVVDFVGRANAALAKRK